MIETARKRRSDRITVQLPIVISGVDVLGETFVESARTIVIARYGAKILCQRKLAPQLEITLHCLMTNLDALARIVGRVSEDSTGTSYGLELLDPEIDIWGVEFPPVERSAQALGRVLVECIHCQRREIVYLNAFEAEVLERSHTLWRDCKRCGEASLWRETWLKADEELPEVEAPGAARPAAPMRTKDDRKHTRLELRMEALVRDPQGWEEVVKTENISCGGFRFKSTHHYALDWTIEVALPRSPGGANIFSAAKVKFVGADPESDLKIYGVAYTPWQDAWADRWSR
jgi:hypothetical protein